MKTYLGPSVSALDIRGFAGLAGLDPDTVKLQVWVHWEV